MGKVTGSRFVYILDSTPSAGRHVFAHGCELQFWILILVASAHSCVHGDARHEMGPLRHVAAPDASAWWARVARGSSRGFVKTCCASVTRAIWTATGSRSKAWDAAEVRSKEVISSIRVCEGMSHHGQR